MNTRHKVFADAYKITKGLTKDLIKSYQVAYPDANKEVARVNGYKLLQKTTIQDYIQEYKEKERIEREKNEIDIKKQLDRHNIINREKGLEMLSNVAKLKYNEIVSNKDNIDNSSTLSFSSIMQTIAKIDGWNAPTKSEITGKNGKDLIPDRPIIVVSTQHGDIR